MKRVATTFLIALASVYALGACSKGSDNSARLARKGEACRTTSDCSGELSCVPSPGAGGGGICVTGEFHVQATAKECAIVQCASPADCCPAGSTTCDASKYTCTAGTCKYVSCTSDTQCFEGKCVAGQCTECTTNANCTAGDTCQSGVCRPPCVSDSECPAFNRCTNGTCTESGCKSDRECIASTKNVQATCGSDGKCVVPCQSDLECGNPQNYSFYSCIDNRCTYVGCDDDKECELYLGTGTGNGTSSSRAVCRDKVTQ